MLNPFLTKYYNGNQCIYCDNEKIYSLSDGRIKCARCQKKYSLKKMRADLQILYLFTLEVPANRCAHEMNCNYNNIKRRYNFFREKIAKFCNKDYINLVVKKNISHPLLFRSTFKMSNDSIAVGIAQWEKKIFTYSVPYNIADDLSNFISRSAEAGNVFVANPFRNYTSLKIYVPKTSTHQLRLGGTESFWSFAKEKLRKYHKVDKKNFYYYLKEFEFRFNYRKQNLYPLLLKIIY